jgi:hypothetical protein
MPRLDAVLTYKNPEVVSRFLSSYPIDPVDAEQIFTETLRWLWVAMLDRERRGGRLFVTTSMFAIDEMWHAFLMYTADYAEFCYRFFGEYIHHQPTSNREKERAQRRWDKDPEAYKRSFARKMERQYRYIAAHLGEDTLRRWYQDFAERFSTENLQRMKAQALSSALPSSREDALANH